MHVLEKFTASDNHHVEKPKYNVIRSEILNHFKTNSVELYMLNGGLLEEDIDFIMKIIGMKVIVNIYFAEDKPFNVFFSLVVWKNLT